MLRQISPKLRRFNIVDNKFTSSVTDTPKEFANDSQELNLMEDGNSSLCFKAEISLPHM